MTVEEYKNLLQKPKAAKTSKKVQKDDFDFFVLLCENSGLGTPEKERVFAKAHGRNWRCDYYLHINKKKVAIEIEGGTWGKSRHTTGTGFREDMEKYNCYSMLGITLLRFTPEELKKKSSKVMDIIKVVIFGEKEMKIKDLIKKRK